MSLNRRGVEIEEERIRLAVRELTDEQRKIYYRLVEGEIRDPDTYAALNYLFLAGLHHFYLSRWMRGALNLGLFICGVALLFTPLPWFGVLLIVGVTLTELPALFRAEVIVTDRNNAIMRGALKKLMQHPQRASINNFNE